MYRVGEVLARCPELVENKAIPACLRVAIQEGEDDV
jgi:hypothetical protein